MQRLEVSGAVRPLKGSLGVKGLHITVTKNAVLRLGIVLSRPTGATSSALGH